MKKIALVITVMIACLFTTTLCMAASDESRVYDYSDLLTDEEESKLEIAIQEVQESLAFDVVILTVDDLEGYTAEEYAEGFYLQNDFGYNDTSDGVIFLVSIGEKDWYIATEGQGDFAINDYCLDQVEDDIIPHLSDGNYYKAFDEFVEMTDIFVTQAASGTAYTYDNQYKTLGDRVIPILIALGIALIIAGLYLYTLVKAMSNVQKQGQANAYIKQNSFNVYEKSDRFLYSNVTKTRREKKSSGGSGGGNGGGSSGGRGGKF
ncbi:MAG: TPM domain-containing protein [Eubacteriales bacterium]